MATPLTTADALRLRLAAQGLSQTLPTPLAAAERLFAAQGQDARAVRHALAARTTLGDTPAGRTAVADAFDAGQLVRSWPMRGTLFASTPAALATLLALTGDRVRRSMTTRRERLGLTADLLDRARKVAEDVVTADGITRAGLVAEWNEAGVSTADGIGYHLICHFCIEGWMAWGPTDGADHRLVPFRATAPGDDADQLLATVVVRYLAGHGPATVDDIAWWTKLPKGQIRRGVETAGEVIVPVDVAGRSYLVSASALAGLDGLTPLDDTVRLLPAFDEWYLGYQDRSLTAEIALEDVIVPGRNGMFRPIIVVGARTVGTWRATKTGAEISDLTVPITRSQRAAVDAALAAVT